MSHLEQLAENMNSVGRLRTPAFEVTISRESVHEMLKEERALRAEVETLRKVEIAARELLDHATSMQPRYKAEEDRIGAAVDIRNYYEALDDLDRVRKKSENKK